jgi:hypothetical protein
MLAKGNHRVTHIDKSCWTPPYVIKQTKFLRLRLSSLRHSWHLPILAITFGSFGLIAPKTLKYLAFQSFDFKRTWWRLFRYALCALNLISTSSLEHIVIRYQGLYYCHWVASLHDINRQVSSAASATTCFIIAFLLHTKLEYLRLYFNKY